MCARARGGGGRGKRQNELMPRVQPPHFCLPPPPPKATALAHARTHCTWAGFRRSVPRLGWEFSFPKEAEPGERAEGLEPQVSPRQRWLPAVIRSGWPGEGTRTPGFVVEIPGYLVSGCHRNFASRRVERSRALESGGATTLRDTN